MSSNRVVPSIFRIDTEACPNRDCSETIDFTLQCGHIVHLKCLGKYMIQEHDCEYKCQVCQSPLNELSIYWDILRKYKMNETEIFYKNLSNTTVMAGLAKYLMETKEAPLEQFLTRTHKIYDDLKVLFPVERKIYEKALLTGDGRIVSFLKSVRWVSKIPLPELSYKFAWENDWMELITDLYEIYVFYGTLSLRKSPINVASYTGNYELMDRLIAHGANIDFWNLDTSPLYCACISKKYCNTEEKIKFIDKYWENFKGKIKGEYGKGNDEEDVFKYAIQNNDIKLAIFLISKNVKPGSYSLRNAISNGNLEMIKIISQNNRSEIRSDSLNQACENEVIEYFLTEHEFDPSYLTRKNEQLIYENNIKIVKVFFNLGFTFNKALFIRTLREGLFDMAKLLIYYGVKRENVEIFTEFDFVSIRNASEERIIEIVGYFLSLEADINAVDWRNNTALSKLCNDDENLPIIKVLVKYGAIFNPDEMVCNPLLVTSASACTNIFKFLISNGADPTVSDEYGKNCYYYALECQNLEMIKLTMPFHDIYSDDNVVLMPECIAEKLDDYLTELGVNIKYDI